ncbi:MAG TPA: hypothetical protein VEB23_15090 [Ramlibacter sp.]|nr:hypothetical protein [Ramlibacter sp.]
MNHPRYITTRSGVRIGSAWTPPPHRIDHDHHKLQTALLNPRTARPMNTAQRIAAAAWRWL